jgi:putative membrane-bound dehydrogenase-like protein
MYWRILGCCALWLLPTIAPAADGNRLTYLDGNDPYFVSRLFPRLTTPQWIGEEGVEAVVILAIDDMNATAKYETYLRPILRRLQVIDGRAPVSIMTNRVDPKEPHLQKWLGEGLSLETHTLNHPCPLLAGGDFAKAVATYERCVDLLASVPGNKPVAFRMPCCDSLNTVSPRFFAEIFNKKTAAANYLAIDSSVFNLTTANDPDLPRDLVLDESGRERFRKYFPTDGSFVNSIEDYPYPYVIGKLCWEFPCVTPSDWEAQNLHKPNNPITIRDWKAQLDACVIKQGVFNIVFHPHNWVQPEQVVDFIDHAVAKHGRKVKFLTFREAYERINRNLLAGQPLRSADSGDNGVRLLDLNNDGYLDVVIANDKLRQTRVWSPDARRWIVKDFPVSLVGNGGQGSVEGGGRFGIVGAADQPVLILRNESTAGCWRFVDKEWKRAEDLLHGLELAGVPVLTANQGRDEGVRLRDVDGDGRCELIVGNDRQQAVFGWSGDNKRWQQLPFGLPAGAAIVNTQGNDNGLRFVDVDGDGHADVVFSNEQTFGLHLFVSAKGGWSRRVLGGKAGEAGALPQIANTGANQGVWFHSHSMVAQNENTSVLKALVDRRPFQSLLKDVEPTARNPQASLASIQVRPGLKVELAASEPLVLDPIAMAWGPDGKMWVVEMGDYPLGVDGKGKPGGRILTLEDTNGDGRYTRATVFLDNLPFPTGVLPWRKGVLVTCAPDIFYAEDTDGDGKADVREVLYTGFVQGNQQHRINTLCWGLDNWIYCANGDSGGKVRSMKTGQTVEISGRDFRIRPDDGAIDLQMGQTQFGRSRNDWGDWFGNNNSNPMWHFALADQYIRRNPHLAAPDARVHVSETPGAARVYPISRTLARFNDPGAANHFTSACSAIVYRDDLFGPAFAGNTFVSEPVHNLVHREIMTANGSTFRSRRSPDEKESEFLASTDNWFRPTTLQTGPDGALWIADMYRAVIEHPQWIPKDWQERIDLRAGADMGRIYRVYPVDRQPRPIPRLDRLDAAGLVAALDSPSGWQRDLAQQMLLWKGDRSCVPALKALARSCPRPLARLHALCALDGLAALDAEILRAALADSSPGVRRHAVRLCEPFLKQQPALGEAIAALATDANVQVRIQIAYTLGEWSDSRAGAVLGTMALQPGDDRFLRAALLSSINAENLEHLLEAVLARESSEKLSEDLLEKLLRLAAALENAKALAAVLDKVATPAPDGYSAAQFRTFAGLLDALEGRNQSLRSLHAQASPQLKAAVERAEKLVLAARVLLADEKADGARQLAALRLLGRGLEPRPQDIALLAVRLAPQFSGEQQDAAIAALARLGDPRVPQLLLESWKALAPKRRSAVLEVLMRREDRLTSLLDAVEKNQIAVTELDAVARQKLLDHPRALIRQRAAKILAEVVGPDRQKVIDVYQAALRLQPDSTRGLAVFAKNCATCHRLGNVGHDVGPALASVGDKSPQGLLTAILDPNRVVEARYVNFTAMTKRGQLFSGVLASETGNSITLTGPDNKQQVILRNEVDSLASTGKSLMPEGLEKEIPPQAMADLIAFVRSGVPLPARKQLAGNAPITVKPAHDGSLLLKAGAAEIYGRTLVLEQQFGNLGYWSSDDDHAVWSVETPRTTRYEVWLDWACPDQSAGKPFILRGGLADLTGRVAGTGGWEHYKQAKVGELVLAAGPQRLTFLPGRPLYASAMMDLRSIKLVPVK